MLQLTVSLAIEMASAGGPISRQLPHPGGSHGKRRYPAGPAARGRPRTLRLCSKSFSVQRGRARLRKDASVFAVWFGNASLGSRLGRRGERSLTRVCYRAATARKRNNPSIFPQTQ